MSVSATKSTDYQIGYYTTVVSVTAGRTLPATTLLVDKTALASATIDAGATSAVCSVFNGNDIPVYLVRFNLKGYPAQRASVVAGEAQSTSSQLLYGRRDKTVQTDLMFLTTYAQAYAEWLVYERMRPLADVSFSLKNVWPDVLARELGDIVHLVESNAAVGSRYAVTGLTHTVNLARGLEHELEHRLAHWRDQQYLVLNDSTLGVLDSRRLSF